MYTISRSHIFAVVVVSHTLRKNYEAGGGQVFVVLPRPIPKINTLPIGTHAAIHSKAIQILGGALALGHPEVIRPPEEQRAAAAALLVTPHRPRRHHGHAATTPAAVWW